METTKLVDAHAHLLPPWFEKHKIGAVIKRAKQNGVIGIVNSSSDPKTHDFGIEVAKTYSNVKIAIGLQPTIVSKKNYEILRKYIDKNRDTVIAIGEVGLDYYWVKEEDKREEQRQYFKKIIQYANETDLPLVIHSRNAETDCLELLEDAVVPVYLHSFEGNKDEIERAIGLGFYIGVPTAVGSRRNWRKVAQRTPLSHLLLETDSPFMPFKPDINPNEPLWIRDAAEYIANLKGIELDVLASKTTANAEKFFNTVFDP